VTRRSAALGSLAALAVVALFAQSGPPGVSYAVSFPEPEHHWLEVEMTIDDLGPNPLVLRMSRSSPGRYAVHEFAKNIFHVAADDGSGRALRVTRAGVDEWQVAGHGGTVRFVYRIFGDRADGTYMAVDTTHAHLNMPATFMWAVGTEPRSIRITFRPPPGLGWTVGTQLLPTADPYTFAAPNLQYFLDSPTELANFAVRTVTATAPAGPPAVLRVMVHTGSAPADVDGLAEAVGRLAGEHAAVFGEFPRYDPGHFTFLFDDVPWSAPDAMEHRNSTVITGVSIRSPGGRADALDAASHEFFHGWNVERIRPVGLEPFDFTRENVTCCLWLAEGFTQYYGPLLLRRAGLLEELPLESVIEVINGAGRQVRSAVEMSEHAPFADAGVANDPDDRARTFISYYTFGAAVALALDLSLRERSGGALSLDDYMRQLWRSYGSVSDPRPGYVARPYSLADLRGELKGLTGDAAFADGFFDRYIEGRDVADYARLLGLAGYQLRAVAPNRGWIGDVHVQPAPGGLLVGTSAAGRIVPVAFGTPAYAAGLDVGDLVTAIDGQPATTSTWAALSRRSPGDRVALVLRRRDGRIVNTTATLAADPALQITPIERAGGTLSPAQRAFRQGWLGTKVQSALQTDPMEGPTGRSIQPLSVRDPLRSVGRRRNPPGTLEAAVVLVASLAGNGFGRESVPRSGDVSFGEE
jgi:predicted metalloprotease with PDZ domain